MGYKVITLFVLASLQKYDIIFIAACPPWFAAAFSRRFLNCS
jgi:hypothetical protein